jgi:hypothetical protein
MANTTDDLLKQILEVQKEILAAQLAQVTFLQSIEANVSNQVYAATKGMSVKYSWDQGMNAVNDARKKLETAGSDTDSLNTWKKLGKP